MCNETHKHFEIVGALSNANTCSLQIVAIQSSVDFLSPIINRKTLLAGKVTLCMYEEKINVQSKNKTDRQLIQCNN